MIHSTLDINNANLVVDNKLELSSILCILWRYVIVCIHLQSNENLFKRSVIFSHLSNKINCIELIYIICGFPSSANRGGIINPSPRYMYKVRYTIAIIIKMDIVRLGWWFKNFNWFLSLPWREVNHKNRCNAFWLRLAYCSIHINYALLMGIRARNSHILSSMSWDEEHAVST